MGLIDTLFLLFTGICLLLVTLGIMQSGLPIMKFLMYLGIWVLVLCFLSLSGFLSDFSSLPPRPIIVLLIPLGIITWFTVSHKSDIFLKRVSPQWLVNMQSFRIVVELFLWWGFLDQALPVQMTFEGRNFDILAGISAPLAATLWLKPSRYKPEMIIAWNIFGLLLLFNIIIIAILSMPTPFRYFMNEPANTIVVTFPWVLLPGILVALAFALHMLSIKQMLMQIKMARITGHEE